MGLVRIGVTLEGWRQSRNTRGEVACGLMKLRNLRQQLLVLTHAVSVSMFARVGEYARGLGRYRLAGTASPNFS